MSEVEPHEGPVLLENPQERLTKTISQDEKPKDEEDDDDTDRNDLLGGDCQDESVSHEGQGQRTGQVVEVPVARVPHKVNQGGLGITIFYQFHRPVSPSACRAE